MTCKAFQRAVFVLFKINVKTVQEATCAMLGSVLLYKPELAGAFMPSTAVPGLWAKGQLFDEVLGLLSSKQAAVQLLSMRLAGLMMGCSGAVGAVLKLDFVPILAVLQSNFNEDVAPASNVSCSAEDSTMSTTSITSVASSVAAGNTAAAALTAMYRDYTTCGVLLFLLAALKTQDPQLVELLKKLLCNSVSTMCGLLMRVTEQHFYCCVPAARLLLQLAQDHMAPFYRILTGSKDVR